jgi:methyltransferase (TIGR00027 family)
MDDQHPSRTAWRVAVRRAAHQTLDTPRIFDDPLAVRILGRDADSALQRDRSDSTNRIGRSLRAFMAVRARIAEDRLAEMYANGIRQYVVLGAGLDTFGYRNTLPGLRVFEVDHPATQAWKRTLLENAAIAIPESLEYVPIDFERRTLTEALADSTFDRAAPAFFSWLGVTMYLTADTVIHTARLIAALPRPSAVVFDYAVAKSELGMVERAVLAAFERRVAAIGEPWTCFFAPRDLTAAMRSAGFERVDDLDVDEINRRYFSDRSDGLTVGTLARVMFAAN